jgi:hypothetical protein
MIEFGEYISRFRVLSKCEQISSRGENDAGHAEQAFNAQV